MTTTCHTAAAVLFLKLEPTWVMIDDIRRLVAAFCATTCGDAERQDQLALAAHELVQNAVANAAAPEIELELSLDAAGDRAEVSVTNRARAEQIDVLRARVARTAAPASPLDAYVAAMREDPHARGGIGLARVRFEAALELALEVRGDRVTLRATGPLAAPRFERPVPAARPSLVA